MLCASSAWSSSFCSSVRRLGSGAGAGPPPMAPAARTARVSPRNLAQTRPRPPAAGYSRRGAPPPTVGCAAAGCGDPPALVESRLISALPLSTSLCGNPQIFAGVDSTACGMGSLHLHKRVGRRVMLGQLVCVLALAATAAAFHSPALRSLPLHAPRYVQPARPRNSRPRLSAHCSCAPTTQHTHRYMCTAPSCCSQLDFHR